MAEEAIRGTCEECGKVFRVPSADRTYTCKACGGTVSVPEEEDDYDDDDDEQEEEDSGRRRLSERHHHKKEGAPWIWIGLAVVLLLGALGWFLDKTGKAPWSPKAQVDLNEVTAEFVESWKVADLPSLSLWHHPVGRDPFLSTLGKIAETREWTTGFPEPSGKTSSVTKGTVEAPETGTTLLLYGEGEQAIIRWQYMPGPGKWAIYSFTITPPPLQPRVEGLKEAWATSDIDALKPFFKPDEIRAQSDTVLERARKKGWEEKYPEFGDFVIRGEDNARKPPAEQVSGTRVESVYTVPDGEFTIRWKFDPDDYAWYVSSFKFW